MKIALVGQGAFGIRHLEALRNVPDVDVVISGSEIETSLGTNRDVEAAGGVVLKRAIAKS